MLFPNFGDVEFQIKNAANSRRFLVQLSFLNYVAEGTGTSVFPSLSKS